MQRKIKILLLLAVGILAFVLRNHNYREIPLPGQSTDEYSNAWVGLSLLKTGVPMGLSGIGGYKYEKREYINIDNIYSSGALKGDQLTFNWPWMDHPPGVGLVLGSWSIVKGANSFFDTNVSVIRRPVILTGSVSVVLVFVLAWILFGYKTGLVSGLIYAVSPMIVFGSKMGQAENFIIPIFLLSAIFGQLGIVKKNNWFLYLAGVCAGLGIWFKLSGIYILLFLVSVSLKKREILKLKYVGFGFFPFLFALVYYYFRLDISNFLSVNAANAGREYGIGVGALMALIVEQKITHTLFLKDPWVMLGWVAFVAVIFLKEKAEAEVILLTAGLSYLSVFLFFGGDSFGWYTYPFLPIVTILLGNMIVKNIESGFLTWIFVLIGGEVLFKLGWQKMILERSTLWRSGMLGIGFWSLFGTRKSTWLNVGAFGLCLTLSAYFCLQMTTGGWYKLN